MKKLLLMAVTIGFLMGTSVVQAGEYTIPYWEKTATNNTLVAIVNPIWLPINATVTIKNANGNTLKVVNVYLAPTKQVVIDTANYNISGRGSIHIFIHHDTNVNIAITAMLYGADTVSLSCVKF